MFYKSNRIAGKFFFTSICWASEKNINLRSNSRSTGFNNITEHKRESINNIPQWLKCRSNGKSVGTQKMFLKLKSDNSRTLVWHLQQEKNKSKPESGTLYRIEADNVWWWPFIFQFLQAVIWIHGALWFEYMVHSEWSVKTTSSASRMNLMNSIFMQPMLMIQGSIKMQVLLSSSVCVRWCYLVSKPTKIKADRW